VLKVHFVGILIVFMVAALCSNYNSTLTPLLLVTTVSKKICSFVYATWHCKVQVYCSLID